MEKDEELDHELEIIEKKVRARTAAFAMWTCFALFLAVCVVFGGGFLQIIMVGVCALSIIVFIKANRAAKEAGGLPKK